MSEAIGPRTRVVDLAGRMLTPGFQDAHCHPGSSGLDLLRCSFEGCASAEDADRLRGPVCGDHPGKRGSSVVAGTRPGSPEGAPPRRLSTPLFPDRPVLVYNADGHGAWANSLALSLAGSTLDTRSSGRAHRAGRGQSTPGTLHEGAAWSWNAWHRRTPAEDVRAGLLAGQAYLTKGITAWQDAHVDQETHRAYRALAASDELIGTAVGALWWSRETGWSRSRI